MKVLSVFGTRPEAVEAGAVKVMGTDPERIAMETERLLTDREEYERMARAVNPYGDGHASERIVQILLGKPVLEFACEWFFPTRAVTTV